jgi:hypothetical protein
MVETEVEPFRTHPNGVGEHFKLDLLSEVVGEVTAGLVHHLQLLVGSNREEGAGRRPPPAPPGRAMGITAAADRRRIQWEGQR